MPAGPMQVGIAIDKTEVFKALAAEQLPRLYSIARRIVDDEAEDVVQEALLKAFQKLGQLRDESSAKAWLTVILINACRDHRRKAASRTETVDIEDVDDFSLYRKIAEEDPFPYSDSLHLDFLQQFGLEDFRVVLRSIPDTYRVPLVLVHMEGFATKEVARLLEVPLGTLLARLHRGRKLFEKKMWDYAVHNGLLKEGVQ